MKSFKQTHKMHHGAHPLFGGSAMARPAPVMPPMMPPGGMGGIQSAGEDMASSAPGGMGGMGAPAGGTPDGSGNSAGAGYRRGGKVMRKARGGEARDGIDDDSGTLRMEKMPSGAQQYVRGKDRSAKDDTISEYTKNAIDDMTPGSDDFMEKFKKADKLVNARGDNADAYSNEVMQGLKKGGMAKGGNSAGAGYRRGGKVRHYAEGSTGGVDVTGGLGSRKSFLEKRADRPLRPTVTQSSPGGLFDEGYPPDVKISNDDDFPSDYLKKAKGGMAKGGNWIKDATKNKGALHRSLGVPEGQKIPMGKIKKAEKSSNPTLAKRARLAETLRGFKK